MDNNKLWGNIGETIYRAGRLSKQIPELKKALVWQREASTCLWYTNN